MRCILCLSFLVLFTLGCSRSGGINCSDFGSNETIPCRLELEGDLPIIRIDAGTSYIDYDRIIRVSLPSNLISAQDAKGFSKSCGCIASEFSEKGAFTEMLVSFSPKPFIGEETEAISVLGKERKLLGKVIIKTRTQTELSFNPFEIVATVKYTDIKNYIRVVNVVKNRKDSAITGAGYGPSWAKVTPVWGANGMTSFTFAIRPHSSGILEGSLLFESQNKLVHEYPVAIKVLGGGMEAKPERFIDNPGVSKSTVVVTVQNLSKIANRLKLIGAPKEASAKIIRKSKTKYVVELTIDRQRVKGLKKGAIVVQDLESKEMLHIPYEIFSP